MKTNGRGVEEAVEEAVDEVTAVLVGVFDELELGRILTWKTSDWPLPKVTVTAIGPGV